MAVVSAPLLSFTAKGQIAKTQVYASWKGRPYVRRLVVPANPKSTEQMLTRNTFAFLSNVWKVSPADFQTPWTAYAKSYVMTNRNAWMKKNVGVLRDETTLDGITLSPGAAGGLSVTPTITGGSGTITIALTAPSPLPAGWTITDAIGAAILDQNPTTGTDYAITVGSDSSDPYSIVLSGLAAGDYQAAGWFVFQKSTLATDLAYGPGIAEVVTVT